MAVLVELLIVPTLLATLMGISIVLSSLTLQAVLALLAAIALLVVSISLISALLRMRRSERRSRPTGTRLAT
jgi:uncharacterized membrane protein HdeD (DUF308 family)